MLRQRFSALLALVALAALVPAAQAGESPAEPERHIIYVPYEKLDQVFKAEDSGVFLPYSEFKQLWEFYRRHHVAGRRKLRQILEAFKDEPMDKEHPKYICAPCSNCKGQLRDIIRYYDAWERCGILYGGLVELIVNAMTDVPEGFLEWEFH